MPLLVRRGAPLAVAAGHDKVSLDIHCSAVDDASPRPHQFSHTPRTVAPESGLVIGNRLSRPQSPY